MGLISFETAKTAKEKGFKESCLYYFSLDGTEKSFSEDGMYFYSRGEHGRLILRPQQSELQQWLREVHNIIVTVTPFHINYLEEDLDEEQFKHECLWSYYVHKYIEFKKDDTDFSMYEEALEQGLTEGLKLIQEIKTTL